MIAKNIAISMNAPHLFSDDFIQAHPAATGTRYAQAALSGNALEAFQKFKTLRPPKAFVIANHGNDVYASWQDGIEGTSAERALAKCEALKYRSFHVISDGDRVF